MLSTISETVEVQAGGLLQLHVKEFKPHTKVNVVAVMEISDVAFSVKDDNKSIAESKGLLRGRITDPVAWQRELRDEWETRLDRETSL